MVTGDIMIQTHCVDDWHYVGDTARFAHCVDDRCHWY